MSILTGPEILRTIRRTHSFKEAGWPPPIPMIEIEPFAEERLGPNSYDVSLSAQLRVYASHHSGLGPLGVFNPLDCRKDNPTVPFTIPEEGFVLLPGTLYLGSTVERTVTAGLTPWLDGRSSIGRLGIQIHATAGRGDDGWCGQWTMEIQCIYPVRIYAGMKIGQLTFFTITGERKPYSGRYQDQAGPTPSRLWQGDEDQRGTLPEANVESNDPPMS